MNAKLDLLLKIGNQNQQGPGDGGGGGNDVARVKAAVPMEAPFKGPHEVFQEEPISKVLEDTYGLNKAVRIEKFDPDACKKILKTFGVGEGRIGIKNGAESLNADFLFTKLSRAKSVTQWRDKFQAVGVPTEVSSSLTDTASVGYAFWFLVEPGTGDLVETD